MTCQRGGHRRPLLTSGVRKTQAPILRAMLMQYFAFDSFSSSVTPAAQESITEQRPDMTFSVPDRTQPRAGLLSRIGATNTPCLSTFQCPNSSPGVTSSQLTALGSMAAVKSMRKRPSATDVSLPSHHQVHYKPTCQIETELSAFRKHLKLVNDVVLPLADTSWLAQATTCSSVTSELRHQHARKHYIYTQRLVLVMGEIGGTCGACPLSRASRDITSTYPRRPSFRSMSRM